jgi:hypothetical protein
VSEKWYIGGLAFECTGCGNCCAGPDEGFIWISKPEINLLSEHLKLPLPKLYENYLKKVMTRTSIVEAIQTKDCVFLERGRSGRFCRIYPVRPNQCRTWPFWSSNLSSPGNWNAAALKCPGINRGRLYSFEEIESIRKQKKWWCCDA